jgi:hypothetical protein
MRPLRLIGGSRAALGAVLQDRAQTSHRLGGLALGPRPDDQVLHQLVRQLRGLGLERVLDARAAARRRLQRVHAEHPDPVVLAAPAALENLERRLKVGQHHVAPRESLQRRFAPEPRPRALAVRIGTRQVPVDQIVV